ncbi:multiple epidermal growth factor-like domains protein 10 isoform X2 [Argopecten irradians]|uniref:multiple epidermal growth factor-like domains protein 10 isoform X2 n=1 Tax=Argopecten irradians TaxID=31199 RepID=UPI0037202759
MEDGWSVLVLLTLCIFTLCCLQSTVNSQHLIPEDDFSLGENCTNCNGVCLNNTCNGTCVSGFYGDECELNCTSNCRYGCNQTTGLCNYCAQNYHGDYCNETCSPNCYSGCRQSGLCFGCQPDWYGDVCEKKCPEDCRHGCDAKTGDCSYGCNGDRWGTRCNNSCPEHCVNEYGSSCFQTTGSCIKCEPGYTGDMCYERCKDPNCSKCIDNSGQQHCYECLPGRTGGHCNASCPAHCKDNQCDQLTGTCTCAAGWFGDDCSMQCFGNCSNCIDDSTCIRCFDGYYGDTCQDVCPSHCKMCSRDGKSCLGMCDGWNEVYGDMCACRRSECAKRDTQGTYKCLQCKNESWFIQDEGCCPCSEHCNGTCDTNNGTCTDGCLGDYHGPTCDTECSPHCNGSCDPLTGLCKHGCLGDWIPPTCDMRCSVEFPYCNTCHSFALPPEHDAYCNQCADGYYAYQGNCVPCSHCLNQNCSSLTGVCNGPCVEGYHYSSITHMCDEKCNENCIDRKCDNTDGNCTLGCQPGFYTENCGLACSAYCSDKGCNQTDGTCFSCKDGAYGHYCFFGCSEHCVTDICDRETGACSECKPGYYGANCATKCDGCLDVTCNQTTHCETGCMPGKYGSYCEKKCPENCYVCDQTSGDCLMCDTGFSGVGYRGANCSIPCPECVNKYDNSTFTFHGSCYPGNFGLLCSENCGNCFQTNDVNECEKFTGYCSNGCTSGYYGMTCKDECLNCQPDDNKKTICDVTSGICQDGCRAGFYGLMCNVTCEDTNCLNNACGRFNGTCSNGCVAGWQGDNCNIAKRTQNSDSSLSGGAIAGIILGVVFGVALIAAVSYFVVRRSKTNKGFTFETLNE